MSISEKKEPSATIQRDRVSALAKSDPEKALEQALLIRGPWFRAQALSWVARFTNSDPAAIAKQAARAATECDDAFKKTAVLAWVVAALAERNLTSAARSTLQTALQRSKTVTPLSSRGEALILLLQAAFKISDTDAKAVNDELQVVCGHDSHWRCKRAVRDGARLVTGENKLRPFFW